jgi:CheY-like chemotaxis protein
MNDFTVMLVDDDSDVLGAIGSRCRARGFNVLRARNLLTALSLVEVQRPDVLCMDVRLPTGNGLSFCESLAQNEATKDIPVIVLTGQRDDETRRRCQQLGAIYIPKRPDVWSELEPVLDKLCDQTRAMRTPAGAALREPPQVADNQDREPSKLSSNSQCEKSNQVFSNCDASKGAPPIGAMTPASRALDARTIVIADDDADLVDSLAQRCSQLGCRVIGAGSALEAINVINSVTPDLVCIDVNMPAGNGLSVCEMMSGDERLRSIPVIVLTGSSDHQTIRRCHNLMVYYVKKCANDWIHIEPLLMELIGKQDSKQAGAGADRATNGAIADSPQSVSNRPATSRSATGDLPGDGAGESLLDAVFAMLGTPGDNAPTDAADQPDDEWDETISREQEAAKEPPWVLCIDDDPDFSDALKCRLESYGVAVIRAFSGMEGYRLAFTHPARAILLDYNMPNGQGDYILGRLKDNRATKDIPVIVITGVLDKWLERKMYGLGASRFLNKPVQFDTLRDELAKSIDILAEPAVV